MRVGRKGLAVGALALLLVGCSTATPEAPEEPETQVPEPAEEQLTPSVTVSDQDAGEGTVTISEVVADSPGWLVIHVTKDGAPGPVIGRAAVEPGANPDVVVEIDLNRATQQLFAMLHLDAGQEGEYEFPGDDVPVFVDEVIVNVPFNASFPIEPAVTASDQAPAEGAVVIDKVAAADPGWIVIHADADGAPGPVIGQAPVIVGSNLEVAVEIDLDQATPTLYAMLHLDAGTAGAYEFPGDDAPVFDADGNVVLAPFALEGMESAAEGPEVLVMDSSFQGREISVPVGTTVTWIYQAALPHTVTADDGSFNSGTLASGDTFTFTFEEAGTFPYYCRFHGAPGGSGMSGVVTVTEG